MTKASVNFKAVKSASHAVSHASRLIDPTYLLPEGKSLGTICLLDDRGNVASVMAAKMALASRQALRQGDYSPVWEGVINIQRPDVGCDINKYKQDCKTIISNWCNSYQKMTGHTVLRADIHLDEGHVVDGQTLLNAHAHVICDKTNERGRVIKIDAPSLRKIQDMTARVTGLDRGESSLKTGRKHIDHQAYKYLAERGRLETQQVKNQLDKQLDLSKCKVTDLAKTVANQAAEIARLTAKIEADYKANRAAMIASKTATQVDYKTLKEAKDKEIAGLQIALKAAQTEAAKVPALETKITQQAEAFDKLKADAMAVITPLRTEVKTMKNQITQLQEENSKLEADKAKYKAIADNYQAEKANGTPSHLITPSIQPVAPKARPAPPIPVKTAPEAAKQPAAPIAPPQPAKSLQELLNDSIRSMLDWIKSIGAEQEPTGLNTRHDGPVKQLDDLHCVQKTGRRYAIHKLADLDKVPSLDDPKMIIKYQDGRGVVTGKSGQVPQR